MTVPSADLELASLFPPATREAWQKLVLGVLRKSGTAGEQALPADAEALLSTASYDGFAIHPLYTAEDTPPVEAGLPGHAPFVRGRRAEGANVEGWDVRALHTHPDAKVTAEAILDDLEGGATSIWLRLAAPSADSGEVLSAEALPDVLREVYLDLAPVVLDTGGDAVTTTAAADVLLALAGVRGVAPSAVRATLGADPLGFAARTGLGGDKLTAHLDEASRLAQRVAADYAGVRTFVVDATPYHDAGGSDAQELGASLATGVAYLRALTGSSRAAGEEAGALDVAGALAQLEFRYAATADQFATIAKLRAARLLWARVAEVCGAAGADRAQHQHAVTSSAMMTRRDPYVNLLRTTIAAFAASVGGADAVTVLPFDDRLGLPDGTSRRLARNIQALLHDESSLARVIDPAGGSWFVESLTAELAEAAWAFFTEIERAGGMAAALASGLVAERIDATWARRREDLALRRAPLTGISEFPNVAETLPERSPAPARAAAPGGLPVRHYDDDYEALRARSDAHLAATGARPVAFLATIGPLATFTPRATFAANLFQAGGLETPAAGPGDDPAAIAAAFTASGAKIACLCSSDKIYAASAAPVAAALKAAGATHVWLAGKPGDRADSDAAAGIDGYVATGGDAVDVLRTALTKAEVA
ncbi:methylmalonyl-CoA mutase subunit beta [Pseudofrankia inefficax]|uniref:Methylmalonyl-CoA mutase n=1 Tax=Pseudofrankia inefficax (strain DSM 45817 / CECT 9037 / DDB 130130 / EuI1c) TaxID=298654 RepID=E3J2Y2_PSEI1|nr:methylmalonyl-CoA mutase subunit beta [Pseudofrankia inefficax]ADP82932.1 Methylmalonyl-CoA mutase [Pseudofrankia inefficax]